MKLYTVMDVRKLIYKNLNKRPAATTVIKMADEAGFFAADRVITANRSYLFTEEQVVKLLNNYEYKLKKREACNLNKLIAKTTRALNKHDGKLEPWDMQNEFTISEVFQLKHYINIFKEFDKNICFNEE